MPHEHADPPAPRPVTVPSWVDRGLMTLGIVLMTVTLISDRGVVKGLAVAAGAGLLAAALTVSLRRRRGSADTPTTRTQGLSPL